MNVDDGTIRRIEDVPAEELEERWVELKETEFGELVNVAPEERSGRLAEMRGVEWLPDEEIATRVARLRGLTDEEIRQTRNKAKRRRAAKAAAKSRARNR